MAKSEVISINDTTPVLLYKGDGTVEFHAHDDPGSLLLGGANLSQSNGMALTFLSRQFFEISSTDEIYGLLKSPNGGSLTSMDVTVFSYR